MRLACTGALETLMSDFPEGLIWQRHSALEVLDLIARGRLSAQQVLEQTLAAIAHGDPAVGAFTAVLSGSALARACAAREPGPLGGLPIGLKDIIDTTDLPTAYGSAIYGSAIDPAQPARVAAAVVGSVRRAGGLVIGKTTTTEFAFLHPTATRNPNASDRTPGGSSAGSAAAVAAGLLPWALGTQTGGSIIRPASYCGVVGYKPSFGLLPMAGIKPFSWSLDTLGVFARTVGDAAYLVQSLSGRAIDSARPRPWIVGVLPGYPWADLSPSAERAIAQASQAWGQSGAQIRKVDWPSWFADLDEAHAMIQGWEATRTLATEYAQSRAALSDELGNYLDQAQAIQADAYARAQEMAARARQAFAAWCAPCDVLLTPSAPDEAPLGYGSTGPSSLNRVWTLLGAPCVTVPGCVGVHGAPMGVQVIGAPGDDAGTLAAAGALQALLSERPALF